MASVLSAIRGPRNAAAEVFAAFFLGNMFANVLLVAGAVLYLTWHLHMHYLLLTAAVAYFVHVRLSNAHITGTRAWSPTQASFHRHLLNYFETRVIVEKGLQQGQRYVFCFSPHGIHGFGLATTTDESPDAVLLQAAPFLRGKIVGLVAWVLFWVPGVREMFLVNGYRDASAAVAQRALQEGNSVALIIGGEAESLLSQPGSDRAVVNGARRKGFVRLALRSGATLVPVYMFHNTDTYSTSHAFFGLRKWLSKRFQICLPLWWGRFCTPLPHRVPLLVVYGAPVPPPEVQLDARGAPTDACVDAYHAAYIKALCELFERHKATAGYPPSRTLEIVSSN